MLKYSFSEEILPHIQPAPPLAQLEAISPCPVDCCLKEEADVLHQHSILPVTLPPNLVSFATGLAPKLSPGGQLLCLTYWVSYKDDRINFFGSSYARARHSELGIQRP